MSLRGRPSLRRGFTLIELLTVIVIILILAGILFPVFAHVSANARRGKCMTQLRSITQAMQIYKEDHGTYPEVLYGASFAGGPVEPRLAPLVKDDSAFTCPEAFRLARNNNTLVTPVNRMANPPAGAMDRRGRAIQVPIRDTYTMQYVPNDAGGTPELHYNPKWTGWASVGLADDRRQLAYKEPPGSTVITWCMYHAKQQGDRSTEQGAMAMVAFLDGRVQQIPAHKLAYWPEPGTGVYPWQVNPKP